MHLFPTAFAILVCSSISSESQSRPLAVVNTTYKHLTATKNQGKQRQRTNGKRHEQEGCDRRHETETIASSALEQEMLEKVPLDA